MPRRFLRKRGAAGEDEDTCGEYPFSLATLASSPKGAPFGVAAKFAATAKAVPLGKVAKPQALTEGVTSGQANFALEPETVSPCQRLPPRGSWQNRQVLTEGVLLFCKKNTTAQSCAMVSLVTVSNSQSRIRRAPELPSQLHRRGERRS